MGDRKTVSLDEDTYNRLDGYGRDDQSFNDKVRELLDQGGGVDLTADQHQALVEDVGVDVERRMERLLNQLASH